jgi:hypothetical protein
VGRVPAIRPVGLLAAGVLAALAGSGSAGTVAAQATVAPPTLSPVLVRATLDKYCVGCHSDRLRTAGLSLEALDVTSLPARADVWEKVAAKLRSDSMPPSSAARPARETLVGIAAWLEASLDEAAAANPDPGRRTIHRLNRAEYANAIRDMLDLDVDGRLLLPADDQGYGFDNNADFLTVSPGLMERYLLAARKVARLAVGDGATLPSVETFTVSRLLTQDDRVNEDLPLGSRGGLSVRHHFPVDAEYTVRVQVQGSTARRPGEQIDVRVDSERVKVLTVGGRPGAAAGEEAGGPGPALEVRVAVKAGPHLVGVSLPKKTMAPEGVGPARLPVGSISFRPDGIAAVEIEGPFHGDGSGDTPSRRRIFSCRPSQAEDEERCASAILSALARRAYRRPVETRDVRTLLGFFRAGRPDGFDAGIRTALERMLVDPEFLFRVEREAGGLRAGAHLVSDLDLASRLSFFLWSSIPDAELLDVAERGKLRDGLDGQVRRMLADPRSSTLVSNFAAQWLHLRNMKAIAPDGNIFPEFDDNLREAFQRETELFLESQIREDRSLRDLLTANYTFVNERLARHYGIPNVYGSHFRRVTFDSPERGGLLGQGSILTVTSYATRTSPVVRGKWLLENILGAPPPPPPANVPPLPENVAGGGTLTVRERMERHRANPVCASCHSRMDPLGFALENFDAIGRWRAADESGTPIDASGAFPDGTTFRGPVELRDVLVAERTSEFAMTVAEKLLTYALGRGVEAVDRPALRAIVRGAAAHDYKWSAMIGGIVRSTPFRMRRAQLESRAIG